MGNRLFYIVMKKCYDFSMLLKIKLPVILVLLFFILGAEYSLHDKGGNTLNNMIITSVAFKDNEMIPKKFTCDGENVSPELSWKNEPVGTKSFVIIVDDPDAPVGTWVHWVLFNIPSDVHGLPEDFSPENNKWYTEGMNDFRKTNYGGPCPPSGTHRYFFKLYALDCVLDLHEGATKNQVLSKMSRHILGKAEIIGLYRH